MKIQQLVKLRRETLDYVSECSLDISAQIQKIQYIKENTARDTVFSEKLPSVLNQYQELINMHSSIVNNLNSIVSYIESEIDNIIKHHSIQKDLQIFSEDQQFLPETPQVISETVYQELFSVISRYVDWHYPGLIINARQKRWIDCLIVMDPLYLTLAKIYDGNGFLLWQSGTTSTSWTYSTNTISSPSGIWGGTSYLVFRTTSVVTIPPPSQAYQFNFTP
jgi:hypothetical protein